MGAEQSTPPPACGALLDAYVRCMEEHQNVAPGGAAAAAEAATRERWGYPRPVAL